MALLMASASSEVSIFTNPLPDSLLFSLTEAAAVQDYKPETIFDENRMLEMLEEIGSVETDRQIGRNIWSPKKAAGIIPVTTSSRLRSCESAPCPP